MNKVLIGLGLMTAISTSGVIAADIEAGVVKRIAGHENMSPIKQSPIDTASLQIEGNTLSSFAAATGISYFEIGYINSSNAGLESIASYQTTTLNDHGGSQLYAYVWQVGYGNINTASINGVTKSPEQSQYRCGSDLHACTAGETVTGWLYLYNLSGQENGTFSVSANSVASPFGYWSDSIYIK